MRRGSVHVKEWVGEAHMRIGGEGEPWPELSPFLTGFVDGLTAHRAVRGAELLDVGDNEAMYSNPTRHVRFRFLAESYDAAERLASDELFTTALRASIQALDPSLRRFGWTAYTDVQPAA